MQLLLILRFRPTWFFFTGGIPIIEVTSAQLSGLYLFITQSNVSQKGNIAFPFICDAMLI